MKKIKTIVICSSASFYEQLFPLKNDLTQMGYKVVLPKTAYMMKRINDFDVSKVKTWSKNPKDYNKKRLLINDHFKKITKGDAVLIINLEKNNVKGYIGGNVLMEMTIAYYFKKPIFILNDISEDLIIKEEIYAINPTFLKGNIDYFKKHV